MKDTAFYNVDDIQMMFGNCSKSKAYKIIQGINKELQKAGYLVIAGCVPKKYIKERYYLEAEG